ncbi:Protein trichome birefringence-like 19 [Camellia lanceoleosa]|uniref:Protein trichome birefringence-like 19 n=1 Tax=Camellia lanceoleosa TaxID=1840588 RepID=A0ACC0I028_9ERIC|nr:Protein trichome birefringence-like 19 [Camellia lanceoleosa]
MGVTFLQSLLGLLSESAPLAGRLRRQMPSAVEQQGEGVSGVGGSSGVSGGCVRTRFEVVARRVPWSAEVRRRAFCATVRLKRDRCCRTDGCCWRFTTTAEDAPPSTTGALCRFPFLCEIREISSLTCCLSTNLTAIFSIDQVVVQKVKESEITEQDSLLLDAVDCPEWIVPFHVFKSLVEEILCLIAMEKPISLTPEHIRDEKVKVARPVNVSNVQDIRFKHWLYLEYNFTLSILWTTHLVRASDFDPTGHSHKSPMNLHLDQVDLAWASHIQDYDYLIISVGQWFSVPLIYYHNNQVIGCHKCNIKNVTKMSQYYGFRMAHQTAFKTLLNRPKGTMGIVFLRTISPAHFENGEWNTGGYCARTRPFRRREKKVEGYIREFYEAQIGEFWEAKREGRERGLKFRLLDTTEAMAMRPDGHPNYNGQSPRGNVSVADCVHWCLPGPIDTWNELLLQMLKRESAESSDSKLLLQFFFIVNLGGILQQLAMKRLVTRPLDIAVVLESSERWFYTDYNFTIAHLWTTHLVQASQGIEPYNKVPSNLTLDKPDETWSAEIENFDFVIISAEHWFLRPLTYYENGKFVGCHVCSKQNDTYFDVYYAYRIAFRTAFNTLLTKFKGITFLRTITGTHVNHKKKWSEDGDCEKTRPFSRREAKLDEVVLKLYSIQLDEFRVAERKGRKKGLRFRVLNVTEPMTMRPDGHPNRYGHWPHEKVRRPDCLHWCLPGPIDVWNEMLLQMIEMENER